MINRVFVSSTSVDLADYRKRVQDVIRQLGAVDISMEHFGARDERPREECLRLVREESDLFVGIYAHRYGYVPKSDEKSITELEYDTATLVKIPRFIYIIDENTAWKPSFIDTGEAAEKLKNFKDRLKTTHLCKFFSNEDQLASFVAADLGRHLTTGIKIDQHEVSLGVSDSKFKITQEDIQKSFIVHDGRNISVEKLALIRRLSLRMFEIDVTDDEIVEWFYFLPKTVSPFEEMISQKSRIFINGQRLESPTPLEVYDAVSRYRENRSTENDKRVIKKFMEIVRSIKKQKSEVLFGYFGGNKK